MSKPPKRDWAAMQRKLEEIEKDMPKFPGGGSRHYIVNDSGEPIPAKFSVWAVWFERYPRKRVVKQEWICNVRISTIFLGLDHAWGGGPPVLWETMTFSNRKDFDQEQRRCAGCREQALAMHATMCDEVRTKLGLKTKAKL